LLELRREERTRERTAATSFVQAVVDGDVNALSKAVAQVDVNFVWRPTLPRLSDGASQGRKNFGYIFWIRMSRVAIISDRRWETIF
jgi:hypothetical protein